ncbi:MAG: hypothetical protein Q8878_03210 [Bacillota bacterium]|nr:hypothetical protein [Bacillota bacterium]
MAQRATRESVAYDYARFDNRMAVREAVRAEKKQSAEKTKAKKRAIPPSIIFTYFAVLIISGVIVFNYMQVTMLSDRTSRLEQEIETLKSEETYMRAKQEKMLNLSDVEEYAKNKLHMVKADGSQIDYIQMSNPDQIQILKNNKDGASRYFAGFIKSFNVVLEYLS